MSTNFVEVVRAGYAALERGDVDFLLAHADPQIEIAGPGARTFQGHAGLLECIRACDGRGLPERIIDGGRERVIAVVPSRGVDLHTGRDGKCIRLEMFSSLDDAFAAVGLRKLKGER